MHPITDIQVLGELDEEHPSPKEKYFIVLQVDEKEAIKSEKTLRGPALGWREEQSL